MKRRIQIEDIPRNAKKWKHEEGGPVNPFSPASKIMQWGGTQSIPDDVTKGYQQSQTDTALAQDPIASQQIKPNQNIAPVTSQYANNQTPMQNAPMAPTDNSSMVQPEQMPRRGNKWAPISQEFNNILGAGIATAAYFQDKQNQRNMQGYNREMGMSANGPQYVNMGGHGDYTQQGTFRPDGQFSQSPAMGYMQDGGQAGYRKGQVVELSESEISDMMRKGYKFDKV